jgi:hypothetical protein
MRKTLSLPWDLVDGSILSVIHGQPPLIPIELFSPA